jgi:hypothetical protein
MQAFGLVGLSLLFGCTAYGGWRLLIGWTRYRQGQQRSDEEAALLVLMAQQAAAHRADYEGPQKVYDVTSTEAAS